MDAKDAMETHGPLRAMLRGVAGLVQVAALVLVLADLVLLSGILERRFLPWAIEQGTGARVTWWREGMHPLYVRNLRVRDAAAQTVEPLLRVDALKVQWRPAAIREGGSLVSGVHLWNARVHVDGAQPEHTNYDFLLSAARADDAETSRAGALPGRVLPESVTVSRLAVYADMPEWTAALSGVHGALSLASLDRFSGVLEGDAVVAGWQGRDTPVSVPFPAGQVRLTLARDEAAFELDADIALPDFLVLMGNAAFNFGETITFDAHLDPVQVEGPVFGELAALVLPVATAFDSVQASPVRLRGALAPSGLTLLESSVDLQVTALRVGDEQAPWYAGDLRLEAEGVEGGIEQAHFTATLNEGQQISGVVSNLEGKPGVEGRFENWTREQALGVWPASLERWTSYLNALHGAGGTFKAILQESAVAFEATLAPEFHGALRPSLETRGTYAFAGGLDVSGTLSLDRGNAQWEVSYEPDASVGVTAKVAALPVGPLLTFLVPDGLPGLDLAVTGSLGVDGGGESGYRFNANLAADALRYDQLTLSDAFSPLSLAAQGVLASDFSAFRGVSGTAALGEAASFKLEKGVLGIADQRLQGALTGACNLMALGEQIGYGDLWGDVVFEGSLASAAGRLVAFEQLEMTFDPLGYDSYSIPYGTPLRITAPVSVDWGTQTVHAGPLRATLGDGTTLQAPGATVSRKGINVPGPMDIKSDLAPLVAKQYLAAATGTLEITVNEFNAGGSGLAGRASYSLLADEMVLQDTLAVLSGVNARGDLALGPALSGEGVASVDGLRVAGVSISGLHGDIVVEDRRVVAAPLRFGVFDGGVTSRAELLPFESGRPLHYSGEVKDLDLGAFTEEFKPESLVLTGKVSGTFSVGLTSGGLTSLDVDMEAGDNFSMNRDMVEQLLLRQYMADVSGGRQMERMIQSVLGGDVQRKFDSALAKMGLEAERITGYVQLLSDRLNITVDIKADPPALLEALRIRQQQAAQ